MLKLSGNGFLQRLHLALSVRNQSNMGVLLLLRRWPVQLQGVIHMLLKGF